MNFDEALQQIDDCVQEVGAEDDFRALDVLKNAFSSDEPTHVVMEREFLDREAEAHAWLLMRVQQVTELWRETDQATRERMERECYFGFVEALDELFETVRDEPLRKVVAVDELEPLRKAAETNRGPEEERWNNAIDWLLNSRHTADPDIQGPFWAHVDGEISLEELRNT